MSHRARQNSKQTTRWRYGIDSVGMCGLHIDLRAATPSPYDGQHLGVCHDSDGAGMCGSALTCIVGASYNTYLWGQIKPVL